MPPTTSIPFATIIYCCPLLWNAPKVRGKEGGEVERESRAGGLFISQDAETIDGEPPTARGAPEALTPTLVEMTSFVGMDGRHGGAAGSSWEGRSQQKCANNLSVNVLFWKTSDLQTPSSVASCACGGAQVRQVHYVSLTKWVSRAPETTAPRSQECRKCFKNYFMSSLFSFKHI